MIKYNFLCDFEVRSSHDRIDVNVSGCNSIIIEEGLVFKCPFGFNNTSVEIEKCKEPLYKLKVESYDLIDKARQIKYLNNLSKLLSFLIGKDEINGHYGTPYVYLKLDSFSCEKENVQEHTLNSIDIIINDLTHISDRASFQSTRYFKFEHDSIITASNHDVLNFYHNGLKANSEKSKFFHWFLILEFLEGTPLYSQMFPKGSMFNEEETKKIRELAETLPNDKKGILLSVLSRTAEYRGQKLIGLLNRIGIRNISNIEGNCDLSIDTIKEIIGARNKLFHSGSKSPRNALWLKLFPIVTDIVKKIIYDKKCVE